MTALRTEVIRVRVTPEEARTIRVLADHDGRTVSGYIRRATLLPPAARVIDAAEQMIREREVNRA